MLPQMTPYRPTLYRPGGEGRFRAYPRVTDTPIPGAGYDVDRMMWAEQELDLNGGSPLQPYGSYAQVPLRGLDGLGSWTAAQRRAYWDARARACQEFGDEGECLAQVARHVPVTIGGLGQDTTGQDISRVLQVTAGLFSNPDQTLRTYGPPIVVAADRHVVTPMIGKVGEALTPYVLKYVLPVILGLYVTTGISAYYSVQNYKKSGGRIKVNRRRRRRRTSRGR